jgi:curved DNA-binding protein CbpA
MAKKEEFVDYYAVLQVWPTASDDVIKKAYFSLAKMYHPDIAGQEKSEQDNDGAIDFKLVNEAYNTLIDPVRRRAYDERLKQMGKTVPAQREADKRSARLAFEQAKTAMKHNRYDKAAVLLKSAIKYDDSNPAYHSWYGFALAAMNTRLHEARDECKRALEMEFYNAEYHANLGFVYYQAGLKKTAEESFREALKWDPDNPVALKYMYGARAKRKTGIFNNIISMFKKPPAKTPPSRK